MGRRWVIGGVVAVCAMAAARAHGQEPVGAVGGLNEFLGVFGLSLQLLLMLGLGLAVLNCVCLFVGTRLAGLEASFGRAVLTVLLAGLFLIPVGLVLAQLEGMALGQRGYALLSQLLGAGAEVAAIMILYRSDFGRAVFSYLSSAVLFVVGGGLLLIAVF